MRHARLTCVLAALVALGGCGLSSGSPFVTAVSPGSVGQGKPLEGVDLTVTSKEFSEQLLLGQIAGLALKAAGASVVDRTGIQGSIGAREAVRTGEADLMYEYTGTGWITYLGHDTPVRDPKEQWRELRAEDLRRNGIDWLPPAPLDNTYAMAVNHANATRYKLRTLSDLARLNNSGAKVTYCMGAEFATRDDGFPGMAKAYGMKVPAGRIRKMDLGIVYTETANGRTCLAGSVFATDGRIPALKLVVLEDDKNFFPNYNAAPMVNEKTLREHPRIADVLNPITKKLTTEVAQRLNAEIDVDGREPHDVALDWLVEEGFVKEG
ncbi:Osmoprotectant-binding protein OsmX [Streptomyces sp. RB5]|uniref:Osmoprotectant-binding protein OsmX n=1 Tax=Streptomyces smaragdinus TaxID=2585196 RepID=A0A7K0CTA0_9ACTN|nr:glycine betaine ABC transporter substrate-binding protein [Streptomyces smaragdinus]MQY16680.1 Osmoprotectant-binding protein OsmX [Streptomyces smaragdinus]